MFTPTDSDGYNPLRRLKERAGRHPRRRSWSTSSEARDAHPPRIREGLDHRLLATGFRVTTVCAEVRGAARSKLGSIWRQRKVDHSTSGPGGVNEHVFGPRSFLLQKRRGWLEGGIRSYSLPEFPARSSLVRSWNEVRTLRRLLRLTLISLESYLCCTDFSVAGQEVAFGRSDGRLSVHDTNSEVLTLYVLFCLIFHYAIDCRLIARWTSWMMKVGGL